MADRSISGASPSPRIESDIRINYKSPSKILAAANDFTPAPPATACTRDTPCNLDVFYSTDGGSTWLGTRLPPAPDRPPSDPSDLGDAFQTDPAVDWTSDGTAWALAIGTSGPGTASRVRSFTSTDAGKTWTFEKTVSYLQTSADRETVWVDHSPTSPYMDQVYATWLHDFVPNASVFFARRTAGLGGTWQAPIQISAGETTGQAVGGDVKTNGFGDVFVFWPDVLYGSGNIIVAKSTDGGAHFRAPVPIAHAIATTNQLSIPAAPLLTTASGDQTKGAVVYVSAGAYRTAAKDLVYAVWTDLCAAAECRESDGPGLDVTSACKTRIRFSRSTDGGATWSMPTKLNDQPSLNDQFNSKLCVDESNGNLLVTYRDTVNDPGRRQTDVWMQTSADDGQSWSAAVQVNSRPSDETSAGADPDQYGDYDGLTGFAGTFFPSWTDRRSGAAEEIWTARIPLAQPQ